VFSLTNLVFLRGSSLFFQPSRSSCFFFGYFLFWLNRETLLRPFFRLEFRYFSPFPGFSEGYFFESSKVCCFSDCCAPPGVLADCCHLPSPPFSAATGTCLLRICYMLSFGYHPLETFPPPPGKIFPPLRGCSPNDTSMALTRCTFFPPPMVFDPLSGVGMAFDDGFTDLQGGSMGRTIPESRLFPSDRCRIVPPPPYPSHQLLPPLDPFPFLRTGMRKASATNITEMLYLDPPPPSGRSIVFP